MITVTALPAFSDNYLWLLEGDGWTAVVDPGDPAVVAAALAKRGKRLDAVLVTHHHPDHIGGIAALVAASGATVYGPRAEQDKIAGIDRPLGDGDVVTLGTHRFEVIAVPGHTLGHIAYYEATQGLLFCGDTLFVGGCGRLFEGSPAQMHQSLSRLAALPGDTAVYCAHEYTLSNYDFATAVLPDDTELAAEFTRLQKLRAAGESTVPGRIETERRMNVFLRSHDAQVASAASLYAARELADPVDVFAALRRWKDAHRPRIR